MIIIKKKYLLEKKISSRKKKLNKLVLQNKFYKKRNYLLEAKREIQLYLGFLVIQ